MPLLYKMYVHQDSIIHRLDPRTKLLWFVSLVIPAGLLNTSLPFALMLAWVIATALLGRLNLRSLMTLGKVALWLMTISIVVWPLFVTSGTTLFQWGIFTFTDNGLNVGFGIALRLATLIFAFTVLMMTTSQSELIGGLQRLRLPGPLVFAIALALRYIPTFAGEIGSVMEAQRSRALHSGTGFIVGKLGGYVSYVKAMFGPLANRLLKMSYELSLALESKAFDPAIFRHYGDYGVNNADYAYLAISIAMIVFAVVLRVSGYGWIPMT